LVDASVDAIVVVTEVHWLTVGAVVVAIFAFLDARSGLGALDNNEVVLGDESLVARCLELLTDALGLLEVFDGFGLLGSTVRGLRTSTGLAT
jgi:hypothetical protein